MLTYVSPDRFTDKPMTLRALARRDYAVEIDGLVAGRIMRSDRPGLSVIWRWTLTGPYCGEVGVATFGDALELAEAMTAMRASFDGRLAWAASQPGPVAWHG